MTPLIQNLLTAGFHGSVIIAAVLLLRLILKKAPKRVVCVLWMLAFIRLLMPFQLESNFSLQPEAIPLEETVFYESVIEYASSDNIATTNPQPNDDNTITQPIIPEVFDGNIIDTDTFVQPELKEDAPIHWTSMLPYFWLVGTICCLLYAVVSYIQLKRTVREAVRIIGCWECDRIETAFILGYIRPRIYVPMGLSRRTRKHILAHEWAHLQTGDHWFKLLAYLACCLHWFNPLVWVAYRLMCKDMEHACDERVVRYMDLETRKQYSHALLTCSTNHGHYTPCPVAFGEVSVKSRILSVLNYRKPSFWITLIAVIAVACVGVFLMTSPVEEENDSDQTINEVLPTPESTKLTEYVDPQGPTAGNPYVRVYTVDGFLDAIAPDTTIYMEAGVYNLWEAENYGQDTDSEYYSWVPVSGGYELRINNLENFTIDGYRQDETIIMAEPRNANVISFRDCSRFEIRSLTAGHTTQPTICAGNVLDMETCSDVILNDLGLFGCGTVGLSTRYSQKIKLKNSNIYDCSSYGVELYETDSVWIYNNKFYEIGTIQENASSLIYSDGCDFLKLTDCEFSDNNVMFLLLHNGKDGMMGNCRFTNNSVTETAFCLYSNDFVINDTAFSNNSILNWYPMGPAEEARDAKGNPIYADDLEAMHYKDDKPAVQQSTVTVSTVDEFLAAIAPNTEIVLEKGTYDLSTASKYGKSGTEYYYWQQNYDGPELIIIGVDNLTIRGSRKDSTTVSAVPRYADVLSFSQCSNITVADLTAGHTTEPGLCAGGVLYFQSGDRFLAENCGLYGCGILGVEARSSSNVTVDNCEIYECSQGGIAMYNVSNIVVKNSEFRDLGGETFDFQSCRKVVTENNIVPEAPKQEFDLHPFQITHTYNSEEVTEFKAGVGSTMTVRAVNLPDKGSIEWLNTNPDIVSLEVDDTTNTCMLEIVGVGEGLITITSGEKTRFIEVTGLHGNSSTPAPTPSPAVTSLALAYAGNELAGNPPEITIAVGEPVVLSLIYYPLNIPVTSNDVTWLSADDSIATVEGNHIEGIIKGVDVGTTSIHAILYGRSVSVTVYVRESW